MSEEGRNILDRLTSFLGFDFDRRFDIAKSTSLTHIFQRPDLHRVHATDGAEAKNRSSY